MFGWEVTREDVENVLNANNVNSSMAPNTNEWDEFVDECFDIIDKDLVTKEALYGDDMDEQIDYANLSIYEQLVEAGKL